MVSRSPSIAFHTQLSTGQCPSSPHLCDFPHMCCLTCVPPLPFHPSVTLVPLVWLFLTFQMSPHLSLILTDSYGMPCRLELYVAPIHRWYHTSDLVCLCHVEFLFWNRSRRGFLGPSENISENYNTVMGIFFPIKEFTIKIEGYFWLGTAWQHIYIGFSPCHHLVTLSTIVHCSVTEENFVSFLLTFFLLKIFQQML